MAYLGFYSECKSCEDCRENKFFITFIITIEIRLSQNPLHNFRFWCTQCEGLFIPAVRQISRALGVLPLGRDMWADQSDAVVWNACQSSWTKQIAVCLFAKGFKEAELIEAGLLKFVESASCIAVLLRKIEYFKDVLG